MGVTERPRSLNPSKAVAMAMCPIIVHFSSWRARSMHDVACKFARAAVRSKDAQKQLARTSLSRSSKLYCFQFCVIIIRLFKAVLKKLNHFSLLVISSLDQCYYRDLSMFYTFYSCKKSISRKNSTSHTDPIAIFPVLYYPGIQ